MRRPPFVSGPPAPADFCNGTTGAKPARQRTDSTGPGCIRRMAGEPAVTHERHDTTENDLPCPLHPDARVKVFAGRDTKERRFFPVPFRHCRVRKSTMQ